MTDLLTVQFAHGETESFTHKFRCMRFNCNIEMYDCYFKCLVINIRSERIQLLEM